MGKPALRARDVLNDVRVALEDFEQSGHSPFHRTRWAALVALLRTVGHVLHNVDSPADSRVAQANALAYASLKDSKPDPAIYWRFIDDVRNTLLKEYRMGFSQNVTVRPGSPWFNLKTGESGSTESGPTTYERFVRAEGFDGRNPADVCREAIAFWETYLDEIERAVAGYDQRVG